MRRFGGVTEEGARQVDIVDQHLILVNQAFLAIKQTLAQQFAPAITRSAIRFIEWAQAGEGAGVRIANAFNVVLNVFDWIGKGVDALQSAVQITAGNILSVMGKVAGFFNQDLGKRFESGAQAAFANAQKNLANVFGLESHRNVTSFFNFVTDKAEQAQKALDPRKHALLETIKGIVDTDTPARRAATDIGQGVQIDLARTVLGSLGPRREQVVKDPQLQETNELLWEVVKRLSGELIATAV